jgi:deoxyribonuclease IV
MNSLRFGTAGIPLSTPKRNTINGIKHVRKLGLEAMELEFVRSVNLTEEKAKEAKAVAKKHDITLTCHGQYYVNLNAQEPDKLKASIERILKAANIANQAGAWSICYHMAYYMGQDKEKVYQKVKQQAKNIIKTLKNQSNPIWLRPETGGKLTQFADIDDLIRLSQDVEQVLPCIDWAHHFARSNGKVNSKIEFSNILEKIENGLGKEALTNMHMHIEGIEYNEKGERYHQTFKESTFNYKDLMKVWKEFKIKGVAICESPNIEKDAITARNAYAK